MSKKVADATILRAPKGKRNPYKMVRQATFEDGRLSWEARGVLAYLLVKPDDWVISVADLCHASNAGRDKVYRVLAELEGLRYLEREERREKGKFLGVFYLLHEEPLPEIPDTVLPEAAEPEAVLPEAGKPDTAEPHTDLPEAAEPYPANPEHTKYEKNTNNENTNSDADASAATGAASPQPPPHLAKQFQELLEQLQAKGANRAGLLRQAYVLCFGEREDTPDYAYLGKVAKEMGAGLLAKRMWELSANPPAGDVLAYIAKAFRNGQGGAAPPKSKVAASMEAIDRVFDKLEAQGVIHE